VLIKWALAKHWFRAKPRVMRHLPIGISQIYIPAKVVFWLHWVSISGKTLAEYLIIL